MAERPANREFFDKVVEVQGDRQTSYRKSHLGHTDVGLGWTALLQNHYGVVLPHPVPASLVCLMMAYTKLNRAALPGLREDDYLDAASYAELAHESKTEEERTKCPSTDEF